MESVNVEMDLRNFIRAARREVAYDAVVAAQAAEASEREAAQSAGGASPGKHGSPDEEVGVEAATSEEGVKWAGVGVLSSRADSRAAAQAFQRLFGIGSVSDDEYILRCGAVFDRARG